MLKMDITNILFDMDQYFLSHLEIVKDVTTEIKSLYNFLRELNNIFHVKDLKRFTFYVKLIDDRRKT